MGVRHSGFGVRVNKVTTLRNQDRLNGVPTQQAATLHPDTEPQIAVSINARTDAHLSVQSSSETPGMVCKHKAHQSADPPGVRSMHRAWAPWVMLPSLLGTEVPFSFTARSSRSCHVSGRAFAPVMTSFL